MVLFSFLFMSSILLHPFRGDFRYIHARHFILFNRLHECPIRLGLLVVLLFRTRLVIKIENACNFLSFSRYFSQEVIQSSHNKELHVCRQDSFPCRGHDDATCNLFFRLICPTIRPYSSLSHCTNALNKRMLLNQTVKGD